MLVFNIYISSGPLFGVLVRWVGCGLLLMAKLAIGRIKVRGARWVRK